MNQRYTGGIQLNRNTQHGDTLMGDSKRSLPPGEGEGEDGGESKEEGT